MAAMALTACAAFALASCGGDDEPSVDEILSDKTTPVAFELRKGVYFMYDYAGANYVGGDTIGVLKAGEVKRNLRRGRHSLVWLTEPSSEKYQLYETHYDAKSRTLVRDASYPNLSRPVIYAVTDINVGEYLMPTQTLEYISPISEIHIIAEDAGSYPGTIGTKSAKIGALKGYPNVASVSLAGNGGDIRKPVDLPIFYYPRSGSKLQIEGADGASYFLCPKEGIKDLQLEIEIREPGGGFISSVKLPKISIRQGESVWLKGPVFSGHTSNWSVVPNPYLP